MYHFVSFLLLLSIVQAACADDLFREDFQVDPNGPDSKMVEPLRFTWGDRPARVLVNAVGPSGQGDAGRAACLQLEFPRKVEHRLSYWQYKLPEPIPLVPQLEQIGFRVRTSVPVSIKVAISPYGFIYHGPGVQPGEQWQQVRLTDAYEQLRRWCEKGAQSADGAWISAIIVALGTSPGAKARVAVDDLFLSGPEGAREAARQEAFRRKTRKVRVAAISLVWDRGHRTIENVLLALDEAGLAGADLACLPQCCVDAEAEPIPGPLYEKMAAKAAQYRMYVVGNLLERDGDSTYVTSFLCDRRGKLVGKYRKTHRLPYEAVAGPSGGFSLGNQIPVFPTDFGPVGLKIGTDHFFPEIDSVLRRRGARLVVWSTWPFPVRDEHTITLALQGRAVDFGLYYAVARYAGKAGYGGYDDRFSWTATWPLGRAQVFSTDGHTVADSGHAGGVAVAAIPADRLQGTTGEGGYPTEGKFAQITAEQLPDPFPRRPNTKRTVRVAAIECEPNFERLLQKLEYCGRQGCDLVCLWEYVWYRSDEEVEKYRQRNRQRLQAIAAAARAGRMYVVIGGELERGFNEAILFDRTGQELGRYTKINQTTPKTSRYYRAGDRVGIFDVDFGRICVKICADVYSNEIDRVAALHQVDLMLLPTQDAGPYTEHTRLRDARRCIDCGYFLVRAASQTGQSDHRTYIMDPWAVVLGASQLRTNNEPVIATLQLDNRPRYYQWPEAVLQAGPYPDPYKRAIRPEARGDLRAIVLQQRRPELYRTEKVDSP